jgi:hypothetical protein
MSKARWDPDGSTATSYAWFVWLRDDDGGLITPRSPPWIPPGRRETLTKPDDRARFAAWSIGTMPLFA